MPYSNETHGRLKELGVGRKLTKPATIKIARGVAEARLTLHEDRLKEIITTVRGASFRQRLAYLFTGRIPLTEQMLSAKNSKGMWGADTYDDWLLY